MVGAGIKLVGHVTLETQAVIQAAEKVLFLVTNDVAAHWLRTLNATAESLQGFYADTKLRLHTYQAITDHILTVVRQGVQLCVVFEGHPGVFVTPAWAAIHQAHKEGFRAWMLPGISAEACLFADLEIEPTSNSWQNFEATAFLLYKRQIDTTIPLLLWQIGAIGMLHGHGAIDNGLALLAEVLVAAYGPDYEVVLYEAAEYPLIPPTIERVPLTQLPMANITPLSTLYIPPKARAPFDFDMMARLGIQPSDLVWRREEP